MSVINWSNRFETSHTEADLQHQWLFKTVDELIEAFRSGTAQDEVAKVLDFLIPYTVTHFSTEEFLMEQYGFPGLVEHKAEHAAFIRQVADLKRRFDDGERITMTVTIALVDWLKYHSYKSDLAFAEFVREMG